MKRLAILTVGKTHSGKSTFAKKLDKELNHSIIIDQDHHAGFINTHYPTLQPKSGPNTLKHSISKLIVDYAKENTNLHFIVCNSNRSKAGRAYLLNEIYKKDEFIRIIVHFNISYDTLLDRVTQSERNTNILRNASSFKEVLLRQQAEDVIDPDEDEADFFFTISNNDETNEVIRRIVDISNQNC
ncbi:tRNA uridine 5-carbamoylmethylation protein Kti12 [Alkalibacillus filiformis]|uniref:tRNA uridine 5-carbamoylmethylation protein Kti12 n=1 Tax=Alkalibacillus filiformis TaxID=200990 RepID=A0ABU0DQ21_9BACI|nr:AAA family ATPase [Alkalibacillus filiformis]MDQ0350413.1 tRNA uridine 5-carbamoylmethylation protein Kti12 [Alkalibacillus filiformis]